LKLKANFKVTPSIPLNPRGKFSSLYVLKGEFTYIFVADPKGFWQLTYIPLTFYYIAYAETRKAA
jgi:hypothetical protein